MVVLSVESEEAHAKAVDILEGISRSKGLMPSNVEKVIVYVENFIRMIILRKRFLRKLRAQCVISAAARGRIARRQFKRDKGSVIKLQARTRGNQDRKRQRMTRFQKQAKGCVESYLRCLAQGDMAALRSLVTSDLEVTADLPSFKHTCQGITEFLAHPTMNKPPPKVSKTHMELTAVPRKQRDGESQASAVAASYTEITLAREVTMGMTDLRQEFTVRKVDLSEGPSKRKAASHDEGDAKKAARSFVREQETTAPFVCAVVNRSIKRGQQPGSAGEPGSDGVERGRRDSEDAPHFRVLGLRESFATLDSDHSGHLSLGEISSAMSLVGIELPNRIIRRQLNGIHTDSHGGFELTELDSVLRRDKEMQDEGIDYERPLIFDVLPLVAKTYDAHKTVTSSLSVAMERDARITADHYRAMRKITKPLSHLMKSPVARLAGTFSHKPGRKTRASDESTLESTNGSQLSLAPSDANRGSSSSELPPLRASGRQHREPGAYHGSSASRGAPSVTLRKSVSLPPVQMPPARAEDEVEQQGHGPRGAGAGARGKGARSKPPSNREFYQKPLRTPVQQVHSFGGGRRRTEAAEDEGRASSGEHQGEHGGGMADAVASGADGDGQHNRSSPPAAHLSPSRRPHVKDGTVSPAQQQAAAAAASQRHHVARLPASKSMPALGHGGGRPRALPPILAPDVKGRGEKTSNVRDRHLGVKQ